MCFEESSLSGDTSRVNPPHEAAAGATAQSLAGRVGLVMLTEPQWYRAPESKAHCPTDFPRRSP